MNEEENTNVEQSESYTATQTRRHMPTIPQLLVALGILALVFGSSYIPTPQQETPQPTLQTAERAGTQMDDADPFETVAIEGTSAFVWDVRNQRALYTKNAQAQLPLASLTKLMTALIATETLTDTDTVRISLNAIQQEGESGFFDGEIWNAETLLDYTLLTSSNDGAYALAAAAGASFSDTPDGTESFIDAMNRRAEELGLAQTYFTNPTGLDTSESQSGGYGSARDMAFLMEHIVTQHPKILEQTTVAQTTLRNQNGAVYTATNTNEIINRIPGTLGSKTGYTVLAGGNLVVAFDAGLNHPIIITVLGSSVDGRFRDVAILAERAQSALLQQYNTSL